MRDRAIRLAWGQQCPASTRNVGHFHLDAAARVRGTTASKAQGLWFEALPSLLRCVPVPG